MRGKRRGKKKKKKKKERKRERKNKRVPVKKGVCVYIYIYTPRENATTVPR